MPVIVKIDKTARVVYSTFLGEISEDDLRSSAETMPAQPGFDPTFSHVIDFSQVTTSNVSPEFVRSFAQQSPVFSRDARQIIVAPQDHVFGLARMAQILRERQLPNIEVVRSRKAACAILGIRQATDE